jgi:hypothetical protein
LLCRPQPSFEGWSEAATQSYDLARAFQQAYPPNSISTEISPEQRLLIQEKGVHAWEFIADDDVNCMVSERTEISFYGGENCVQTNLPIPKNQPIYYFEVKLFEKPVDTNVGIGVATKPYPSWRFPGVNKTSVGYHSQDGKRYYNDPFDGFDYGGPYHEGDVIGCGYRPRSGTVFFTRNGVKLGDAFSGLKSNLFPTVAADGPCSLHVNLGQLGFVFIEANVGKWGLAPAEGSLFAPPAYGYEQDTLLLESARNSMDASRFEDTETGSSQPFDFSKIPNYPPPQFTPNTSSTDGQQSATNHPEFRIDIPTIEQPLLISIEPASPPPTYAHPNRMHEENEPLLIITDDNTASAGSSN